MYQRLITNAFLILVTGLFWCRNTLLASDVIVKSPSDQGIVIEFLPQQWQISSEIIADKPYIKVSFEEGDFQTSCGEPLLPVRRLIIGIPFDSRVSFQILGLERGQCVNGKLIPTPTPGRDGLDRYLHPEKQSIYQEQQPFPSQMIAISPPAIIRDQQVIVVMLYPVQFFPDRNRIELYSRMTIGINVMAQQAEPKFDTQLNKDISLTDQILLNPVQSAKWKKKPNHSVIFNFTKTNYSEWYKIWIREEGIYKVTGTALQAAGIELQDIKPYRIKIFNNGGFQLPPSFNDDRPDSLIENAIAVIDGGDGSFDAQDYILFFGKSVNGWSYDRHEKRFSHYLNPFTKENVYWLCFQEPDSGKRMKHEIEIFNTPGTLVTSFNDHLYIENERENLLNSGTLWLGEHFNLATPRRNYSFDLSGALPDKAALVRIKLAGISSGEHNFSWYFNDLFITQIPTFYNSGGNYLNITTSQYQSPIVNYINNGYNRLTIEYRPKNDVSLAYLDWIELSVHRELKAKEDQLLFYGSDSVGVYTYHLDSFSSNDVCIYDVSCYHDVSQMKVIPRGNGSFEFIDSTGSEPPKLYLAVTPQKYESPIKIERELPSDLRNPWNGADFIIITYDDFYDAALALKSLRENCDTIKTDAVKISDVYDEFSWGLPDPTAIRDFIKYAFSNWQKQPQYVLLLGDGDYDYKNMISPYDPNWIPAYETAELDELLSRARDDWYTCVAGNDNLMDLAIGRLPARNPDQAMGMIKKIIDYENTPTFGEWCNMITMVADDEFGHGGEYDVVEHIPDADDIVESHIPKSYDVQKIYLTEFPAVKDASISGIRKPAAKEGLLKQINQGSLVINFIGHGNEYVWTHERILVMADDLSRLNNGPKQAFWIAATCNFGRFDNPNNQSFAEQLVTVPKRGAIAVFSACRLASPGPNVSLNRAIYQFLFDRNNRRIRLGDAVLLAKNSCSNSSNDQCYHLLGDPTLRLVTPSCQAQITHYSPDTMRALSRMNISGNIQSPEAISSTLQGQALFKTFDSRKVRNYKVREGREWNYKLPGNIIFRGEVTVNSGLFKTQFFVPKDITYGGPEGRFSVIYWNNQFLGSGNRDRVPIGGTQTEFHDDEGPVITIGFEGQDFFSGCFVPLNPVLRLTLADSMSGINIAGDIGHKITMVLDDAEDKKVDLNDYFNYDRDNHLLGHIYYPLTNLSEGIHRLQLKAWDNYNNSSQTEAEFTVVSQDQLVLKDLLNYPNPFSKTTEITFSVNQSCEVEIKVFALSGRLICKLDHLHADTGFNHFYWNGLDQDGEVLANGVYLYKVVVSCYHGAKKISTEQIEKCAIMR